MAFGGRKSWKIEPLCRYFVGMNAPARTLKTKREDWPLDTGVAYLNHGGYGVLPLPVAAAQAEWRARIERNPTGFLSRELEPALRAAASAVAGALGARGEDIVFVENATSGINSVLRSLRLGPGDEIAIASTAYPAVLKAARFVAEACGARLIEIPLPLPVGDAAEVRAAFGARLGSRTLLIVDHIASASALVMPLADIVRDARSAGARVLVDGAHAPGQVPLEMGTIGADWYVGNLHKWFFAPRSCGFLWAAPDARDGLHPLAISHGLGQGFTAEFDWTGTRDFTAALAAPAGIAFHRELGGETLMTRNQALVRAAASRLAMRWGTELAGPSGMFAAMATVRLPAKGDVSPERALRIVRWLAEAHRIEVNASASDGALWLRIAAQAYNESSDYDGLAAAVVGTDLP
jgi:isopenicillin-N epimerase